MKFTALVVEPDTNEQVVNLIFADPESNPDEPSVLMFSRAIDIPDSMYYFEINDQSSSSYGGLEAVKLTRNSIEIRLGDEAAEKIGNEDFRKVYAEFAIDDELHAVVKETLETIFKDSGILEAS